MWMDIYLFEKFIRELKNVNLLLLMYEINFTNLIHTFMAKIFI